MQSTCVGLASGIGAGNPGCGEGPLYLMEHLPKERFRWDSMVTVNERSNDKCAQISQLNTEFAQNIFRVAKKNAFFFSMGGDHSAAIGTWSGVSEAYKEQGDLGLIWIDAHMDSHTPETTPSGNIHGMPLASLLGYGDTRLSTILSPRPKLKPENVFLIGIRDFEEGEAEFLKTHDVKVYFMDEVRERGLKPIFEEVLAQIASRTVGYGVSFDMDAIDPNTVIAVGTPVANGIDPKEAIEALSVFRKNPPVAFELVEYIPYLDKDKRSFLFIEDFLESLTSNPVLV
jgi:arginase